MICRECGTDMNELKIGQQVVVSKKVTDDNGEEREIPTSKIIISGRGIYFCQACQSMWQDPEMVGNRHERRASASRARRAR